MLNACLWLELGQVLGPQENDHLRLLGGLLRLTDSGAGLGFRAEGSGFRAEGSGFRAEGSGFRAEGPGLRGLRGHGAGLGLPHVSTRPPQMMLCALGVGCCLPHS